MLSLSEDLLFVWEPPYLVMLWRAPCLPKWKWMGDGGGGGGISVKNLVVG